MLNHYHHYRSTPSLRSRRFHRYCKLIPRRLDPRISITSFNQGYKRFSTSSRSVRSHLVGRCWIRYCAIQRFLAGKSFPKVCLSLIRLVNADDRASGRDVGEAILFYGCHSKEADALYDTELTKWEKQGVVSIRHAFSRSPSDSMGCKHVQYVIHLSLVGQS